MKHLRVIAATVALATVVSLSACAPTPGPVVAPVTVAANDLQGSTVTVALNQIVNITTGSLAVDSYTAKITDESVVTFVQGRVDGGTTFDPGLTPLKVGSTSVTLTNKQGGIQPLTFTVTVTK